MNASYFDHVDSIFIASIFFILHLMNINFYLSLDEVRLVVLFFVGPFFFFGGASEAAKKPQLILFIVCTGVRRNIWLIAFHPCYLYIKNGRGTHFDDIAGPGPEPGPPIVCAHSKHQNLQTDHTIFWLMKNSLNKYQSKRWRHHHGRFKPRPKEREARISRRCAIGNNTRWSGRTNISQLWLWQTAFYTFGVIVWIVYIDCD